MSKYGFRMLCFINKVTCYKFSFNCRCTVHVKLKLSGGLHVLKIQKLVMCFILCKIKTEANTV